MKKQEILSLTLLVSSLLGASMSTALGQAGALDAGFQPNPSYVVSAVAIDPDGKMLVAGAFRLVNGLDRVGLVRLETNGAVDLQFAPNLDAPAASTLALQPDGKILIGGGFYYVDGVSRPGAARLNSNGSLDASFNPGLAQLHRPVSRLVLQSDGKVLVLADDGLHRLLPDGQSDPGFRSFPSSQSITNADGSTVGVFLFLMSVVVQTDGKILLGGSFPRVFGRPHTGLVRLHGDGTLDPDFAPVTNWTASALALQSDGMVILGGPRLNGEQGLARFHTNGMPDASFSTSAYIQGDVNALALQPDGKILVGGYYEKIDGLLRPAVSRFTAEGALDRDFDAGYVDGFTVTSLGLQADGMIVMGGFFTRINGQSRPYLARLFNDAPAFAGRFEFLAVTNAVNEAGGSLVIPVRRYAGSAGTVTVDYDTPAGGSAWPGVDFVPQSGTLTFAPGQTSNHFVVPINDDPDVEGGFETLQVVLRNPTGGATLGSQSAAVGLIMNDDIALGFEGSGFRAHEAAREALVHVARWGVTNAAVSVRYETGNGTATAPDDYTPQSGTIEFAPGEIGKTLAIPIVDDELVEGEEMFHVDLSQPTGGALLASYYSNAVVVIADDVSLVELQPDRIYAAETDGFATLTLRRTGRTNNAVSVQFATSNLTALAGSDYVATVGTVEFPSNGVSASLTVPLVDDDLIEDFDQFTVSLFGLTGAAVFGYSRTATVNVVSDDGPGHLDTRFRPDVPGGGDIQLAPGNGGKVLVGGNGSSGSLLARLHLDGTRDTNFQPNLPERVYSFAIDADGSVFVSTGFGVGTGVLRLRSDGAVDPRFAAFYVDYRSSGNEFATMLAQADGKLLVGAVPAPYYGYNRATNYLNRLNRDGSLDTSFNPPMQLDGEPMARGPSTLALQADGKILVAAYYVTRGGTWRERLTRLTATGELDPTFNAPAGIDGTIYGITLLADGKMMLHGSFTLIGGVSRNFVARLNSDGSLDPTLDPPFIKFEGQNGYVLDLVAQPDHKLIVCGAAVVPDVVVLGVGRLLADGRLDSGFRYWTGAIRSMALQGNGQVLLSGNPVPGGVFGNPGLTRLNNDPEAGAGTVEFSACSYAVTEADTFLTVSVRRVGGTNGPVQVRYATRDATATAGADYEPQTGLLEFGPGQAGEKEITLVLHDDLLVEGTESFVIGLGKPIGGAAWGECAAATITILDNDTAVQLESNEFHVREHDGVLVATVQRLGGSAGLLTVNYSTHDQSAQAGADYLGQSGTLTFADGETNQSLILLVLDDEMVEGDETFQLTLSAPSGRAWLGSLSNAVVTIVDDDRPGTVDATFDSTIDLRPLTILDPDWGELSELFWVNALALQPDGRLLVGGAFADRTGTNSLGLVRLTRDGLMDWSFAPGGSSNGVPMFSFVSRMALQADGKVLVAAESLPPQLYRLHEDGWMDESFQVRIGGWSVQVIKIQPDGRILLGGSFTNVNGTPCGSITRLNPDGTLDHTFNPGTGLERVIEGEGSWPGEVNTIELRADGRIIVGGHFHSVNGAPYAGLVGLTAAGAVDDSFNLVRGLTNEAYEAFGPDSTRVSALALQPDGRLLVAGWFTHVNGVARTNLVRLHADGTVDISFTAIGLKYYSPNFGTDRAIQALAVQPDGRILVGGTICADNTCTNLLRLNSDGSRDETFDPWVTALDLAAGFPFRTPVEVRALILQPDGQVLIGGRLATPEGLPLGLARINGGVLHFEFHSLTRVDAARLRLRFAIPRGQSHVLQAGSDLVHWSDLNLGRPLRDQTEFTDVPPPGAPQRFYRARKLP